MTRRRIAHTFFAFCVGFSVLGPLRAFGQLESEQQKIADRIKELGGRVFFDYQINKQGVVNPKATRSPASADEDGFQRVVRVEFGCEGEYALPSLEMMEFVSHRKIGMVTSEDVRRFADLPKLRTLILSGTDVSDEAMQHLTSLPNLKELTLGTTYGIPRSRNRFRFKACGVTDAGMKHVGQLSCLRRLNLRELKITDLGVSQLKCLTQLEVLNLVGCHVTDAGLRYLAQLKNLKRLDLVEGVPTLGQLIGQPSPRTKTKVTAQGVEVLRRELPNCKIVFR